MLKSCPDSVDVTDLQFKLQCRLKIFENNDISTFSKASSLLTCASRYGLLFVGTNSKHFQVILTQNLQTYTPKDKDIPDYPRRTVDLPSPPKHLCVNCDNTIIAVVVEKDQCPVVIFYDVVSFLSQNIKIIKEVRLSSTINVYAREINWNPSLPAIFTACKSDGTLGVYELKGDSVDINELPTASGATCFCWSPKGKQIAVGSKDGKITQYKPDLKAVKVINEPQLGGPHTLISLQWVSNYQFIGVYQSVQAEGSSSVIVVDAPKTGEPSYTNYDDICYSGSSRSSQFYLILQQNWNFLMVASANSSEVGVLGSSGDSWTQWIMSDTARAELPLSPDHQETLPVGLTFDTSSTTPLPWGESTIPPCPLLCILSHHGLLCCFNVVYLKPGIPSICTPAESVPSGVWSGLKSFIPPPGNQTPATEVVQSKLAQHPPTQLHFGIGSTPQTMDLPAFKDTTLSATRATVPLTIPTQSTPLVTGKPLSDFSSKALFGGQATLTPIKPQQPSQGVSLFAGQTLITPISKGPNTTSSVSSTSVSQSTNNNEKYSSIFSSLNPTTLPPAGAVPVKPIVISATANTAKPPATLQLSDNPTAKVTENATSKATFKQTSVPKQEYQIVDPKLKAETSAMLSQMIRDEWMYLEAELKVLLNQGRALKISLGTGEEKVDMIRQIESLQEFVKEAVDISVGQSSEIHCLKQNLIQSWAWFEEANSYYNSSKNEAVALLLKLQPLDSVSQKRHKEIEQLTYYIESQLLQVSKTLDEQWGNFQDYAKKTYRVQMPTMETIFQTMVRQSAILQKHTYILKDISMRLKKKTFTVSSLLLSVNKTENLADDLRELHLDPNDILQLQYEKIKNHTKILSNKKANMLRDLLKQRELTRVTAVRPQLSSWTINQSPASKMRQSISILGAQISPVSKNTVAKSLSFIQSTPLKSSEASKPVKVSQGLAFSLETPNSSVTSSSSPVSSGFVSLAKSGSVISNSQGSAFAPIRFMLSGAALENQQTVPKGNVSAFPFLFGSTSSGTTKTISSASQVKPSFSTPSLIHATSLGSPSTSEQAMDLAGSGKSLFESAPDTPTGKSQSAQSLAATSSFPFSSSPSNNSLFLTSSGSPASYSSTQIIRPTNVATASSPIKPVPTTSSIFNAQQSSFTSLSKSPSVTTITTALSTSTAPKTSGVASIFSNLQSVIDKATGSSGVTSTTVETSKPTMSIGISTGAVTTTTQSLFGSASSISASKSVFGTTTFSSTGNVFGSVNKPLEAVAPTSNTSSIFGNSNISASTTSSSKPETFNVSFGPPNLLENVKQSDITTESFSVISSTSDTSNSSSGLTLTSSQSSTTNKNNELSNMPTTTQISVFGPKPIYPTSISESLDVSATTTASAVPLISSGVAATVQKTGANIFGAATTASIASLGTTSSIFGSPKTTATTASSVFETASHSTSIFGIVAPTTTTLAASGTTNPNIFGASTPTSTSSNNIFTPANSQSIFRSSEATTAAEVTTFGSTTTSASIFGSLSAGNTIFGAPPTTSIFAPATTSSIPQTTTVSAFEASTTPAVGFGTSTSSSAFVTPTTSANIFASPGIIFGSNTLTPTTNIFGTPTTTSANVFGTPTSTPSANIFGTPASTAQSIFGSTASSAAAPFGSQSSSTFGTPKTTGSVFGQQGFGSQATTASSIFGQPTAFGSSTSNFGSSTTTTSGNIFGNAASSSNEFGTGFGAASATNTFGSQATTQPSAGSFGFGSLTVDGSSSSTANIFGTNSGSVFGATPSANPFGKVENKSPFGSSSANIFGNSPAGTGSSTNIFANPASTASSIFGSSGATTFGTSNTGGAFGSPSTFGSSSFGQKAAFGQASSFGSNTFGSPQPGSFSGSGGASPIAQTGFGSSATFQKPSGFGSPPAFGGSPTPAFGAAPSFGGTPAFGGAPSFGSPEKVFGASQPASGGFGAATTQQSAGFGNLASQNTIGFGNLAQQANTPASSPFSSGFLATGKNFEMLKFDFLMGSRTISCIVKETCHALWEVLQPLEMKPPSSKERWEEIAENFYKKTDFPNCLGAVDGKHLRLICPQRSGSNYYNYKTYFSIVLLAVVDADYRFIAVDVGAYGRESDSNVFNNWTFGKKLTDNQLNLPDPKALPNTDTPLLPYVFLGDEAFSLNTHFLRPYPRNNLTNQRRLFNYRLSRARRLVECSFGILSNKWRVFHTSMSIPPDFAMLVTKAACVLHNFVRSRDGYNFEDSLTHYFENNQQRCPQHRSTNQGRNVRDHFAQYFVSPVGEIPWQYRRIQS